MFLALLTFSKEPKNDGGGELKKIIHMPSD